MLADWAERQRGDTPLGFDRHQSGGLAHQPHGQPNTQRIYSAKKGIYSNAPVTDAPGRNVLWVKMPGARFL